MFLIQHLKYSVLTSPQDLDKNHPERNIFGEDAFFRNLYTTLKLDPQNFEKQGSRHEGVTL